MLPAFPHGTFGEHIIQTSDATNRYNCIAWSVDIDYTWIWPEEHSSWPNQLPKVETVENFKSFYQLFGFKECFNSDFEKGFDKVALYCEGELPCHAAKILQDKKVWSSKLGRGIDISHLTLKNLEDAPNYGQAAYYFKRPKGYKVEIPEMNDPNKHKIYMHWDNR